MGGRIFEAPVALIGKQVMLLYHEHEPEYVELLLGKQSYGMATPVNIHVNYRVKRDKNCNSSTGPAQQRKPTVLIHCDKALNTPIIPWNPR